MVSLSEAAFSFCSRSFPPAVIILLLLFSAACTSLHAYRTESILLHSTFTVIENYSTSEIHPAQVDLLLLQVAQILGVQLDPAVPKPRIVVTSPDRIDRLHSSSSVAFPGHARAAALYFPGANLVMIPYFDRIILGHELAHYVTDHYLKVSRDRWEEIAHEVEWALLTAKPTEESIQTEATNKALPAILPADSAEVNHKNERRTPQNVTRDD